MRCVIVFSNEQKVPDLLKGLRSRTSDVERLKSFDECKQMLDRGQYAQESVLIIIDAYLEVPYPLADGNGGPGELNADHPAMRLMALIRMRRPKWTILSVTHAHATNDGALSVEESDGRPIRAHNYHSTDVSKWYGRVLQNAIELALRTRIRQQPRRDRVTATA